MRDPDRSLSSNKHFAQGRLRGECRDQFGNIALAKAIAQLTAMAQDRRRVGAPVKPNLRMLNGARNGGFVIWVDALINDQRGRSSIHRPRIEKLQAESIREFTPGGRFAGASTAAAFLSNFTEEFRWAHLDIAGTASLKSATDLAPAGATGWGVRAINQLIIDKYET